MISAIHLGALAACVVLFVPMGMAGLHLSRNKMLFFSGALFITLAIGVHVTPYFPSLPQLLSSLSPPQTSCLSLAHHIVWDHSPNPNLTTWDWAAPAKASPCGLQRLRGSDASELLNGSWIIVAGDSQVRLFALELLNLVVDGVEMEEVRGELFKRHSDYRIDVEEHGIKVDFMWAPYEVNLTAVAERMKGERGYPDVLVMGSGLWHMLHFTNASEYGYQLGVLRRQVEDFGPRLSEFGTSRSVLLKRMFWLGMPVLVNSMLNTEEKREKMSGAMWDAYGRELADSKLLRGYGGPFVLLDIERLSRSCGVQCTSDGMHYGGYVYEAAVQVMLNVLLIESQQGG